MRPNRSQKIVKFSSVLNHLVKNIASGEKYFLETQLKLFSQQQLPIAVCEDFQLGRNSQIQVLNVPQVSPV